MISFTPLRGVDGWVQRQESRYQEYEGDKECSSNTTVSGRGFHHDVRLSHYMPRGGATAYCSSFVCVYAHSVCYIIFVAHAEKWELKLATQVKLDHYLAFEYVKVSYEALFSSYGMICLHWLPLMAIWTSLKATNGSANRTSKLMLELMAKTYARQVCLNLYYSHSAMVLLPTKVCNLLSDNGCNIYFLSILNEARFARKACI